MVKLLKINDTIPLMVVGKLLCGPFSSSTGVIRETIAWGTETGSFDSRVKDWILLLYILYVINSYFSSSFSDLNLITSIGFPLGGCYGV